LCGYGLLTRVLRGRAVPRSLNSRAPAVCRTRRPCRGLGATCRGGAACLPEPVTRAAVGTHAELGLACSNRVFATNGPRGREELVIGLVPGDGVVPESLYAFYVELFVEAAEAIRFMRRSAESTARPGDAVASVDAASKDIPGGRRAVRRAIRTLSISALAGPS
jgi:hypothetical protein